MTVQGVQGLCRVVCRVESPAAIGVCRVCKGLPNAGAHTRNQTGDMRTQRHAHAYAPLHTLHTLHRSSAARVCAVQGGGGHLAHLAQAGSRSRAGAIHLSPLPRKGGRGGQS